MILTLFVVVIKFGIFVVELISRRFIMYKKLFVVMACLLLATVSFAAGMNAKFGLELRGNALNVNATELTTAYQQSFYMGYPSLLGGVTAQDLTCDSIAGFFAGADASFQYFATPNFAIALRGAFTNVDVTTNITMEGLADDAFESHVGVDMAYIGVGGRYYIDIAGVKGFYPYIGADVGMFMLMNGFWEIYANPDVNTKVAGTPINNIAGSPDRNDYAVVDFGKSFFGADIEAGAQYMFTDTVGMSLGVGYRLASAPFPTTTTGKVFANIFDETTGVAMPKEVNLGGIYVSGGLNFNFGGTAGGAATGGAAAKGTGAGAKYEAYGDYYMKAKNYAGALKYYGGAMKLDPKNAGIYKKIGMCYYYMKDMNNAKKYFAYYLRLNPNDAAMKKWLGIP